MSDDIIRAIGEEDLRNLESHLKSYSAVIEEASTKDPQDPDLETRIRAAGKKLKEFSDSITHLERTRVNDIILNSKRILIFSFWVILAFRARYQAISFPKRSSGPCERSRSWQNPSPRGTSTR